MSNYKDLLVWQKGINLVKSVYQSTACFPQSESFSLISQMRRSAVSIPSNIAEGFGRRTDKEVVQLLYISLGSSYELETQLLISRDIEFINSSEYSILSLLNSEISKMLNALVYRRTHDLDSNNNKPF